MGYRIYGYSNLKRLYAANMLYLMRIRCSNLSLPLRNITIRLDFSIMPEDDGQLSRAPRGHDQPLNNAAKSTVNYG